MTDQEVRDARRDHLLRIFEKEGVRCPVHPDQQVTDVRTDHLYSEDWEIPNRCCLELEAAARKALARSESMDQHYYRVVVAEVAALEMRLNELRAEGYAPDRLVPLSEGGATTKVLIVATKMGRGGPA